ncbi:PRC-barrel domain-containing protein, partial [Microvirga roseola]|uniref:PRC-barrel domain-containing protein n=1 Tax=Microvirga roseola TaxID=2883126 RepID=UPI001E466018
MAQQQSPVPQPNINQQGNQAQQRQGAQQGQQGQQQFGQQQNQQRQGMQAQRSQGMQQGQQGQGVAASDLQDQTIYTQSGQQVGTIDRLVQDRNNRTFAVITSGDQQALVPANRLAYRDNRFIVTGSDEQLRFQAYNQQVATQYREVDPEYRLAIVGYEVDPVFALRRTEQQQMAQTQDEAGIVVRQPAPTVRVNPA